METEKDSIIQSVTMECDWNVNENREGRHDFEFPRARQSRDSVEKTRIIDGGRVHAAARANGSRSSTNQSSRVQCKVRWIAQVLVVEKFKKYADTRPKFSCNGRVTIHRSKTHEKSVDNSQRHRLARTLCLLEVT